MKISVSLLAYNEGESIESTIRKSYASLQSQGLDFELWIMDNHSTDNTVEILNQLTQELPRLKHHRQVENVGYAMNSLSSFKVPTADIYITLDGDGQFTVDDVPKMIAQIKNGNDLVVGWRVQRKDPFFRIVINRVFNKVTQFVLPNNLHDLNCGYRALSQKAAQLVQVRYKEKFVGPEIFARCCQYKLKFTEVPVQHFERVAGVSVFTGNFAKSIKNMIKYLFVLRSEIKNEDVLNSNMATHEISK